MPVEEWCSAFSGSYFCQPECSIPIAALVDPILVSVSGVAAVEYGARIWEGHFVGNALYPIVAGAFWHQGSTCLFKSWCGQKTQQSLGWELTEVLFPGGVSCGSYAFELGAN